MTKKKKETVLLQKKKKQESKAQRKLNKKLIGTGGAGEEEADIGVLVKEFLEHKPKNELVATNEILAEPPTPRAYGSLTFLKSTGEFFFFGGEYYDGKRVQVYADLFRYNPDKNIWRETRVPAPAKKHVDITWPSPRCSHQAISHNDRLILFGGEYSTSTQFHHFGDLWVFDPKQMKWELLKTDDKRPDRNSGSSSSNVFCVAGNKKNVAQKPCPRSGHRMILWKNYLLLFGGFQDNSKTTCYYNDLYMLNLNTLKWVCLYENSRKGPTAIEQPGPRAACHFVLSPTNDYVLMFGGFIKTKDTAKNSAGAHLQDAWTLDLKPLAQQLKAGEVTPTNVDRCRPLWHRMSRKGKWPSIRNCCGITTYKKYAFIFGGVFDRDLELTKIKSVFYNDLYAFNFETQRWYAMPVESRKKKMGGHRDKAKFSDRKIEQKTTASSHYESMDSDIEENQNNISSCDQEEEYIENTFGYIDENGKLVRIQVTEDVDVQQDDYINQENENILIETKINSNKAMPLLNENEFNDINIDGENKEKNKETKKEIELSVEDISNAPMPRISCLLAVKNNFLYVFGGLLELGDREVTLDDIWRVNLSKRDEWENLFKGTMEHQVWEGEVSSDGSDSTENSSNFSSNSDEEHNSCTSNEEESSGNEEELHIAKNQEIKKVKNDTTTNSPSNQRTNIITNKQKLTWEEFVCKEFNKKVTVQTKAKIPVRKKDMSQNTAYQHSFEQDHKTPMPDENLKEFFSRTEKHWVALSMIKNEEKQEMKDIKRRAFSLAQTRYTEYQEFFKTRYPDEKQTEEEFQVTDTDSENDCK